MILQRISEHAYVGRYDAEDFYVLFDGGLILPKGEFYSRLKDVFDDVNVFLSEPRISETLTVQVSLNSDESQAIFMQISSDMLGFKTWYISTDDFGMSLVGFITEYLNEYMTDTKVTAKAVEAVIEERREGYLKEFGESLREDLDKGVATEETSASDSNEEMADAILNSLPPAIVSTLSGDKIHMVLEYVTKYGLG